jgi:transcriptional regulator NrdR family protein
MLQQIIKRKGHKEYFDARKIYSSVFAACIAIGMRDQAAELIADMVKHEVEEQITERDTVTAHFLHELALTSLTKYHPDVAYMYEHHKNIG